MSAPTRSGPLPLGSQLSRRKPVVFRRHHHPGEELGRTLTTFQLTMFGVGATVGTGIFFVLSESVPEAGPAVILSFSSPASPPACLPCATPSWPAPSR
jgi:amino acid permease